MVASLMLRCGGWIAYHVAQCREAGVGRDEMLEAFSAGLVVGGSIVIPHMRRAVAFLDEHGLDKLEQGEAAPTAHDHAGNSPWNRRFPARLTTRSSGLPMKPGPGAA